MVGLKGTERGGEGKEEGEGGDWYHGDGHGGWVRDGNGAEHVRAVGLGREFDGQVCDGEAAELIQAWCKLVAVREL